MPRIRTVKPEFCTSEQVVSCSRDARLLFILMWNFCDDQGIHPASPVRLKMEVFPGDDLTTEHVSELVEELITHGLLVEYSANGEKYWRVTGWDKHQKVDKPSNKYPKPDESQIIRRTVADASPPEGKGREGSRRESKGREGKASPGSYEEVSEEILRSNDLLDQWITNARKRFKSLPADADRLRVFTAAEHALNCGRPPASVFVAIVKAQSWGEASSANEDRARKRLLELERSSRPALTDERRSLAAGIGLGGQGGGA